MDKLQRFIAILKGYIEQRWYGKIELSIEAGSIVNIKVTENIKP